MARTWCQELGAREANTLRHTRGGRRVGMLDSSASLLSPPRMRGPIRRVLAIWQRQAKTAKSVIMGPRLRGDDNGEDRGDVHQSSIHDPETRQREAFRQMILVDHLDLL